MAEEAGHCRSALLLGLDAHLGSAAHADANKPLFVTASWLQAACKAHSSRGQYVLMLRQVDPACKLTLNGTEHKARAMLDSCGMERWPPHHQPVDDSLSFTWRMPIGSTSIVCQGCNDAVAGPHTPP
jgi:hypothetical protein